MALQNTSFEQIGGGGSATIQIKNQSPITANLAAAYTLVIADFVSTLLTSNNAGAQTLTLPLATAVEAAFPNLPVNARFEFSVSAVGAGAATIIAATGWTLVGQMTVAAGIAIHYRVVKTALNAFTLYQIA